MYTTLILGTKFFFEVHVCEVEQGFKVFFSFGVYNFIIEMRIEIFSRIFLTR